MGGVRGMSAYPARATIYRTALSRVLLVVASLLGPVLTELFTLDNQRYFVISRSSLSAARFV